MAHQNAYDGYYQGEFDIAKTNEKIAEQYHKNAASNQDERDYYRDILNDVRRHRKAIQLINEVEDQIRRKRDLTADPA